LPVLTALHIATALGPPALYLLAAALLMRALATDPARRPLAAMLVAQLAALVHAGLLFSAIRTPGGVTIAITDSASLVGWVVGATVAVAMAFTALGALPVVLFAVAALLALGTGLLSGFAEIHTPQWEVSAHIALAALAAGWLAIAVTVVLLLTWQDTRLRARRPLGALALLPPVETMESILFRALGGGFVVLTLALVTGSFFVHDIQAQHLTHKIVLAIAAWIVFGVLLWGRVRAGWRGRRARLFTVGGFVILALAYFGSKFVLENLLGRHWG
jgi:ABC-type uncharacterized transport system permease subunit